MDRILEAHGPVTLIAATVGDLDAEVRSVEQLCHRLGAAVPGSWPPEHMDADTVSFFRAQIAADPLPTGWWTWYVVADSVLVGSAGYKGPPSPDAVVEIGYSIVPSRQRRGYGTIAVRLLVARALRDPAVTAVAAETMPELEGSVRVLIKNGFAAVDGATSPGAQRYLRRRL